jgi:hypothetical protein
MMKCNCNCISFILHINTCLYIHNTIDITLYYDRTYGGGRSSEPVAVSTVTVRTYINCISLYNRGANLPKLLHSKALYQLYFNCNRIYRSNYLISIYTYVIIEIGYIGPIVIR